MSARPREFDTGLVSRFKLLTVEEIAQLDPPKWLIAGILPEAGFSILFGEPGAGKTFIALDWALSIATGTPCLAALRSRAKLSTSTRRVCEGSSNATRLG